MTGTPTLSLNVSYVNALNAGTSRATIAFDIAESPEAVAHLTPAIQAGFKIA